MVALFLWNRDSLEMIFCIDVLKYTFVQSTKNGRLPLQESPGCLGFGTINLLNQTALMSRLFRMDLAQYILTTLQIHLLICLRYLSRRY